MRLAIGTAQFGMPYGISNKNGQTSELEIKKILDLASVGGVDTLDTAITYGKSEATLGQVGVTGWNVISKIPPMTAPQFSCEDEALVNPSNWRTAF